MRKPIKISLLLVFTLILLNVVYPQTGGGALKSSADRETNLKYRFEYLFQGEATGVILLFFRYRFFFYSAASVLFDAKPVGGDALRFDFHDLDQTGYLIRTWGFGGKMLITGAADYDLEKARKVMKNGYAILKEKTPYYSRFIKQQKAYLYKILSRGSQAMGFTRESGGVHRDCHEDMKVEPVEYDEKYGIYFKIFPMLMEMVKIYNHSFFPGSNGNDDGKNKEKTPPPERLERKDQLEPGREWLSPPLDFSKNINRIGAQATDIVEKYVTFQQAAPFRIKYRVEAVTNGIVHIVGKAVPQVKIWDGYKLWQVTRTIEIRQADRVVLADTFQVEIRKGKDKGGFAQCALTLIR